MSHNEVLVLTPKAFSFWNYIFFMHYNATDLTRLYLYLLIYFLYYYFLFFPHIIEKLLPVF